MRGIGMFDRPGIFYTNDPKIIFDDDWLLDYAKIKNLKKHNLCVLDFSSENYGAGGLDHVYQALEQHELNFLLLTHNIYDHQRLPKLFFYSFWYYYSIKFFNLPKSFSNTKHFTWSCLNCNPRPHRIYNFYIAKSKSFFDQSIFSMHDYELVGLSRPDDLKLSIEVLNFWNDVSKTLPHINAIIGKGLYINIPAFTDCYVHLISESTIISQVFITEKTWKPIAAQQLFLVLGNPGTIQALRLLGVDVYDDIVDHSYDTETDCYRRIDLIYKSLENLLSYDLEDLYRQTEYRRKKNFDLFLSESFGSIYKQDLANAIDTYIK